MRIVKILQASLLLSVSLFAASIASSLAADTQTVGLFQNDEASYEGYTLFKPNRGTTAYLINNDGLTVHSWDTGPTNIVTPYLQEDGSIIWLSGGVQHAAWDGTPIWSYPVSRAHHDVEVLPNGNVLVIAQELKTPAEASGAGRADVVDQDLILVSFITERIIEVEPTGPSSGNIVWEWKVWDHLVQDVDPSKDNFASVADHPELVDINFGLSWIPDVDRWLHANSVDYNPELDQIMFSVRQFSEFWVIDHSTTTEEAAGHGGGNSGKGGDLLYRWGNPQAYDAGDEDDQMLFQQHDAQWIAPGSPGAGNILVFNNGVGRPEGSYSSVDELVPPVDASGNYALSSGEAFGPDELIWSYSSPSDFYSAIISGASRLPNGNTLIDAGVQGTFFEVTPEGELVWKYVNPAIDAGPLRQGDPAVSNQVFKINRYPLDHPAFAGRDLTPRGPIERPKPTATVTTTPIPPTVPIPATPTSTPIRRVGSGDVNGDGSITAIDAALLLQFVAGLLAELPDVDRADVSGDGSVNAIDAALILQTTAGLISATLN